MALLFSMEFVAVRKADGGSMPCQITIDQPTKMAPPYGAYEAPISLEGPGAFFLMMRGAHPVQVVELALFALRGVLALHAARWTYQDLEGQPLDFSYDWPDQG